MAVLDYLAKVKMGLGLAFGAHFLHGFFHKNVPYLILYQWTKFQFFIVYEGVLFGEKNKNLIKNGGDKL